jgi:plastocyanin
MSTSTDQVHPLRSRVFVGLAAAALLGLGLAACGGDDGANVSSGNSTTTTTEDSGGEYGGGGGETEGSTVVAKDFSLTSISVAPGAEVTFENEGDTAHTMTADDGEFDAGEVAPGATATVTAPAEAGDYAFHCKIHPSMTGTLTVEA